MRGGICCLLPRDGVQGFLSRFVFLKNDDLMGLNKRRASRIGPVIQWGNSQDGDLASQHDALPFPKNNTTFFAISFSKTSTRALASTSVCIVPRVRSVSVRCVWSYSPADRNNPGPDHQGTARTTSHQRLCPRNVGPDFWGLQHSPHPPIKRRDSFSLSRPTIPAEQPGEVT